MSPTNPPDLLTDEELEIIRTGSLLERQRVLIEAVQRAYDRGWDDAAAQWEAHVFDAPQVTQ